MKVSWGTGIATVYIAFAVSTLGFVAFASTQTVDLVRTDYYEESLLRNERTSEERNARELGKQVSVTLVDNVLVIRLPSNFAESPGTVRLYRASSSSQDVSVPLMLDTTGAMIIDMSRHLAGRWDVELSWKTDKVYRFTQQVYN